MLKSSRHPYQTTTYQQTNFPVGRNPWVEKVDSSTNSSCGSRSGHTKSTVPQAATEWLFPANQTLSHLGPLLNQQVHPVIMQSHSPGSALSGAYGSSGGMSANGRIGSCGGQCVACETFCYYCLQVIFIAGILTGIALTIAGSVLHESQREGDLVVLLYIGVLLVLVCILLLSVHCCARHNVKERKRALRMNVMEGGRRETAQEFTAIPVQDYATEPSLRNSFAETDLNEFGPRENPRPFLNVIPSPNFHQHSRLPANSIPSMKTYMYERCPHKSEIQHHYEWGKNVQTSSNRLFK